MADEMLYPYQRMTFQQQIKELQSLTSRMQCTATTKGSDAEMARFMAKMFLTEDQEISEEFRRLLEYREGDEPMWPEPTIEEPKPITDSSKPERRRRNRIE